MNNDNTSPIISTRFQQFASNALRADYGASNCCQEPEQAPDPRPRKATRIWMERSLTMALSEAQRSTLLWNS